MSTNQKLVEALREARKFVFSTAPNGGLLSLIDAPIKGERE